MEITPKQKQALFSKRNRYRNHPDGRIMFAREVMNLTPEPEQEIALRLFQEKPRVAIKSGHGVGKTVTMDIIIFSQLFCYYNTVIVCTAPTLHQIKDQMWREAAKWLNKCDPAFQSFLGWSPTKLYVKGNTSKGIPYKNTWYAQAVPSSNPNNLQGFHGKNLTIVVDEAPGIKESAFEVIEGALTEKSNKLIMIGNPTRITGTYYNIFKDPGDLWGTATFNSENSKNVDPGYAERMAKKYGKDSNIYRVRVLGLFPTGEDDSILTIDLVNDAVNRELHIKRAATVEGGCDVARYGNDKTIIYIRSGYKIVDFIEIDYSDLVRVQNEILRLIRKHNVKKFKIDATGMGGGVVDNVTDTVRHDPDFNCDIVGIDNIQLAIEEDEFDNAGTEMYFQLREWLKYADIPDDEELIADLVLRKYKMIRGRMIIENKEELRKEQKRQGLVLRSPDKGDALALCFYDIDDVSEVIHESRQLY